MDKPIRLNLTGEWEDIVNNVERHNARCRFEHIRKQNKLQKMVNKSLCYAMVAALAVILSFTDLLAAWVAIGVEIPCLCAACFIGGRVYEEIRK